MSVQKAREQVLWELLQEYKRKFRPIYMSLVAKEIFLDIMNIEQKDLTYGKNEIPFTEEEWYKFKDALIKGFKLKNFNQFISIYFKNGPKFEFESNFRDCVAEFEWWIKTGSIGQTYFQNLGRLCFEMWMIFGCSFCFRMINLLNAVIM